MGFAGPGDLQAARVDWAGGDGIVEAEGAEVALGDGPDGEEAVGGWQAWIEGGRGAIAAGLLLLAMGAVAAFFAFLVVVHGRCGRRAVVVRRRSLPRCANRGRPVEDIRGR